MPRSVNSNSVHSLITGDTHIERPTGVILAIRMRSINFNYANLFDSDKSATNAFIVIACQRHSEISSSFVWRGTRGERRPTEQGPKEQGPSNLLASGVGRQFNRLPLSPWLRLLRTSWKVA